MKLNHQTLYEALQRVVGKPLLSVDFVEDYVQLEWQGSFLTAYTAPKVLEGGIEYGFESPDYRRVMHKLEGQVLSNVDVILGNKISFLFSSSTLLTVSLRDADYLGPEAVQFGGVDSLLWVV